MLKGFRQDVRNLMAKLPGLTRNQAIEALSPENNPFARLESMARNKACHRRRHNVKYRILRR